MGQRYTTVLSTHRNTNLVHPHIYNKKYSIHIANPHRSLEIIHPAYHDIRVCLVNKYNKNNLVQIPFHEINTPQSRQLSCKSTFRVLHDIYASNRYHR